jgi:hypothetical protein
MRNGPVGNGQMARPEDQVTELYLRGFVQTACREAGHLAGICFDPGGHKLAQRRPRPTARDLGSRARPHRARGLGRLGAVPEADPVPSMATLGLPSRKAMRSQHGDARFLAIILKCSEAARPCWG